LIGGTLPSLSRSTPHFWCPSADAVWRQEELLGVLHKKLEDIKVVQQRLSQARKNIESLLEDMFDFDNVPSLQTQVGVAQPPVNDCTPK
jgi:hypothetical protein